MSVDVLTDMCQTALSERSVDITHQHSTHRSTQCTHLHSSLQRQSVFVFASRFLDPQCNTGPRTNLAQKKRNRFQMVAEHKTPTVDVRHDGPDAVPRNDAAGTGASAAAHGTDCSRCSSRCGRCSIKSSRRMRRRRSKVHLRVVGTKGSHSS